MLLSFAYRFINIIYEHSFFVYKYLYFFYKYISDREKIKLLRQNLKPRMVVLELGGNIGFYSILFSKLVGAEGEVHVFEPDPLNFRYLQSNTRKLNNINLYNLAVGNNSGQIKLYKSKELNIDHRTYECGEERECVNVQCVSIDEYFSFGKNFDFIKIDIQGYDCHALEGMKSTVRSSNKLKILSELWPYGLRIAGRSVDEYLDLLSELHFEYKIFGNKGIDEIRSEDSNKFYYTDV